MTRRRRRELAELLAESAWLVGALVVLLGLVVELLAGWVMVGR
jgi:hypothetical protein